jgi:hypothetical protein
MGLGIRLDLVKIANDPQKCSPLRDGATPTGMGRKLGQLAAVT